MFSKSLFKQSCKANGLMWIIITVAVCFMLSCVMLIAGKGDLGDTKVVVEDTIVKEELKAQTEGNSVTYFSLMEKTADAFDGIVKQSVQAGQDMQQAVLTACAQFTPDIAEDGSYSPKENTALATIVTAAVNKQIAALQEDEKLPVLNENKPNEKDAALIEANRKLLTSDVTAMISGILNLGAGQPTGNANAVYQAFYKKNNEAYEAFKTKYDALTPEQQAAFPAEQKYMKFDENDIPCYLNVVSQMTDPTYTDIRKNYLQRYTSIFLAGNLSGEKKAAELLESVKSYGIDKKKYDSFGYINFSYVQEISEKAIVNYRSKYDYEVEQEIANTGAQPTPEAIARIEAELTSELSGGLLAKLPETVAEALKEIGAADLYGVLVGSVFFKMAGLLLPIIYMIMTANALIAGQVDSGSMAYVLSTGTRRKEVTCTQALFLVSSLFVMFVLTTVTSLICFVMVDVATDLTFGKLLLINLGAFLVMFAMSGICFLASCVFNRSKRSMALGGGLNMFFLVATMLGLFGSKVLPSIIRMNALNAFNYVSIISLFDVVSILEGGFAYLWKWAILVVVGVACYIAGSRKFERKDLPL